MTRKAGRAARKAGAATEQAGAELAARKPLTAAKAKRMIGISKAVAPLLAPYALAAATVARGRWDAYRAARLGVRARPAVRLRRARAAPCTPGCPGSPRR